MEEGAGEGGHRCLLISHHYGEHGATGGFRWAGLCEHMVGEGWSFEVFTATRPSSRSQPGVRVNYVGQVLWPGRLLRMPSLLYRPLRRLVVGRNPFSDVKGSEGRRQVDDREEVRRAVDVLPIRKLDDSPSWRNKVAKVFEDFARVTSEVSWAAKVVVAVLRSRHSRSFSGVITSSPPHLSHLAGLIIAKIVGKPHVVDFRDPWIMSLPELRTFRSPVEEYIEGCAESIIEMRSSLIVHNTEEALHRAEVKGARRPRRVAIPNGRDSAPALGQPDESVFTILFSGWIHSGMDIRGLLKAVSLLRQGVAAGSEVRIQFLGSPDNIEGLPLDVFAFAYGLDDCISILPRVPREEAMRQQSSAAALVVLDNLHPLAVAMKFYDYTASRGHLILLSREESALDRAGSRIGFRAVNQEDVDAILQELEFAFERWRKGDYATVNDPEGLFERRHTADLMMKALGCAFQR